MSGSRVPHSWVSGGEPPAFLVCQYCGLEHTRREDLGLSKGAPFWLREPEGEWRPRVPPATNCPWREFVKDVVGKRHRLPSPEDGGVVREWLCYGFDPRYGYRMRTCDDGLERVMDINPRKVHR